jgi:hypothetical protein
MVLMIFSASCRYRCGFWTEIRSMSSDLITVSPRCSEGAQFRLNYVSRPVRPAPKHRLI